jgi:hypothetical protein
MIWLIPIICSLLYFFGGRDQWSWCPINQKLWRKVGIGLFIGVFFSIILHSYTPLISILTYLLPYAFPYGENSWIKNRNLRWVVYGSVFGCVSFSVLGVLYLLQGAIGGISFWGLMYLSNVGVKGWKLSHKYTELAFGFLGTICYILCR